MLTNLFWILLGVIVYTYIGYTILLFVLSIFTKRKRIRIPEEELLPEVTLVIAAYNEKDIISEKVENSNKILYPKEKIHFIWITDGSDDGSEIQLANYKNIQVLHQLNRAGKTAALNRAMEHVTTAITVFCDANTMLHPESIKWLVASLDDSKTGCVAGEKNIINPDKDNASGSGEGFYWKYESKIKKIESRVGSTIGAAGELFAIKTELFTPPNTNTITDDFVISLSIALKDFKIQFQPKAKAFEKASFSISEEKKRKIRIAAGSFQVLFGMPSLLNIFKHGMLSFQYFSHKVLRWIAVPFSIPLLLIVNTLLVYRQPTNQLMQLFLLLQALFYLLVLIGYFLQNSKTKLKIVFLPYYIIMMNYTIILGFFRYLRKNQDAAWEKVRRNS